MAHLTRAQQQDRYFRGLQEADLARTIDYNRRQKEAYGHFIQPVIDKVLAEVGIETLDKIRERVRIARNAAIDHVVAENNLNRFGKDYLKGKITADALILQVKALRRAQTN